MEELTVILLVLGVLLAIVTLVGHGIWVLLAAVFGARSKPAPPQAPVHQAGGRSACPRCLTPLDAGRPDCFLCGWPGMMVGRAEGRAAMAAVREQLNRFARLGLLDEATRSRLAAAIQSEEERLAERAAELEREVAKPQAAATPAVVGPAAPAVSSAVVPVTQTTAVPIGDRARKFAAARAETGAVGDAEPSIAGMPPEPRQPAVPVSRLLAAFMEEKNIRWGELVGGLLIVGSSIALVISFWSEIAARPLLKFVLFNGVTAALFGVGLYTDRRWKIHTTSHGVLMIATLLVPLNFLAIAAFTQDSPPTDLLSLTGEGVSLAVFSLLVYLAGQILVAHEPSPGPSPTVRDRERAQISDAALLAIGVMVPSLMQLLVRRLAEPTTALTWLYALAAVPIASYVVASVSVAWKRLAGTVGPPSRGGQVDEASSPEDVPLGSRHLLEAAARHVLVFLGLVSAATVLPLALLVYKVPPIEATLHRLSPLVTVCGLPALVVGLLCWQRITDRRFAGIQTVGIGVGVLGALVMIAAVVFAWPEPALLLPTALATAVAMVVVALWFEIPVAHLPAGAALAAAWLIGFYLVRGDVTWTLGDAAVMRRTLVSALSGHALVPLAGIFAVLAWYLNRLKRGGDALQIGLVAATTAALSLVLVVWFGFGRVGDPQNATWTLAIYALAALTAAVVLARADAAQAGSALLLATLSQAIVYRYRDPWQLEQPLVVVLLAHASSVVAICLGLRWFSTRGDGTNDRRGAYATPAVALAWSGLVTSLAAAAGIALTAHTTAAVALAVNSAWLAAVWLALALLFDWWLLRTASQLSAVFAVLCGVTAAVETRSWYTAAAHPWLDPWFLEAQGIALAGYCLVVGEVRRRFRRGAKPQAAFVGVDDAVLVGLVALVVMLATYAVVPGVAQELAPLEAPRGAGAAVRIVPPIEQFQIAGIPHAHAADRGAWGLLAAVVVAFAAGMRYSSVPWRRTGLFILAATVCPLIAAWWEPEIAVASALRWLSAGLFALVSGAIWLRGGTGRLARDLMVAILLVTYAAMGAYVAQSALTRSGMPDVSSSIWPYVLLWTLLAGAAALVIARIAGAQTASRHKFRAEQFVLVLLAIAPLAVLATFSVARALDQHPIVGPEPGSWFRRIGWGVSYGVPLATIALTLVGYAIRDRSSQFAFVAGLLFNVVATIVVLMRLARGGGTLDAVAWITVAQVNAIVAGGVALAWLAAMWREATQRVRGQVQGVSPQAGARASVVSPPLLLTAQIVFAAALCATFLLPAMVRLAVEPDASGWAVAANGALGWSAAVLASASAAWGSWRRRASQSAVAVFVAALVALVALTAAHWDNGNWLAYHTLLAGTCAGAWLLPLVASAVDRLLAGTSALRVPIRWSEPAARFFAVAAVVLAVRAYDGDPASPWWTVAVLATIGARNVWIAWHERRGGFVWIAALLVIPAASILWLDWAKQFSSTQGLGELMEFLWFNVLAMTVLAMVSVLIHRRSSVGEPLPPLTNATVMAAVRQPISGVPFHRFAAWTVVTALLMTTSIGLFADLQGSPFAANIPLAWAAWGAAALTALACWWDAGVRWPVACLYCVGFIAVGIFLDGLNFREPLFQWALALALAAYSLATSWLWSVRKRLGTMAVRLGAPPVATSGHGWLVSANILLGVGVLLLVWWIEQTLPQFGRRMVAAYAVGAQALAIGFLARGTVRTTLQYLALVWGVLFAVAFAWAWIPPDFPAPWLHRLVVTVASIVVTVVVYGFGFVKFLRRENEWTRAAARLVPVLSFIAVALMLCVLAVEVRQFLDTGGVPIVTPAIVAIGAALAGLAIAALIAALLPGRDPLGLTEHGRTLYVYAAEVLGALLFVHIRVTMPWLFQGWFVRFWPLVVMGIAFVGVGFGELFERRRQRVLAEPLHNTGALLPLLPALGFWFVSSQVHYSLLLLSIGVLYAALSVLRRWWVYAVLAAIAANGSLWFWLYSREGLGFLEHPQLWLIPPALAALLAGYINRERLTAQQLAALRYAAALLIYVSSTADVFINGVADAPWLPAVLAGLSTLGVFAGIMLRVRAFLYLGTAFLIVALMTIIWHAAIHQQRTWILWIAGIVTGVLIIALFGLFEKRRDDVLRVVEQLKHWEA